MKRAKGIQHILYRALHKSSSKLFTITKNSQIVKLNKKYNIYEKITCQQVRR